MRGNYATNSITLSNLNAKLYFVEEIIKSTFILGFNDYLRELDSRIIEGERDEEA